MLEKVFYHEMNKIFLFESIADIEILFNDKILSNDI